MSAAREALAAAGADNDVTELGLARLMTLAFEGVDLAPIASRLIARASNDPDDADALMSLSIVLQLRGLKAEALSVQACALRSQRVYERRASVEPALRLLALVAPGDLMTNAPLEFLVEDSDIALSKLYLTPGEPLPSELPAHDVLIVAASESDRTQSLLESVGPQLATLDTPVINRPERILQTSRTLAHARLRDAPGITMPASVRLARADLTRLCYGKLDLRDVLSAEGMPIIVRPVDSHAGHGLAKLDSTPSLQSYLDGVDAGEFFVSRFVDYRSVDGLYRKFRIVLVDGVAYPAHMAVSSHWMIHYLNAGMTDCGVKRAEEQAFMAGFESGFGHRHALALQTIADRFGLEYLVIDCAELPDGKLLVFELDPGAVVHSMDPPDMFPYKRPQMERIFAAFRDLLGRRAAPALDAAGKRPRPGLQLLYLPRTRLVD